jgi:hypothetical protein
MSNLDDIQLNVLNDITPKILDFLKTKISNYKDANDDGYKKLLREFSDNSIAKMDIGQKPDIIYKKMYVDVDQAFREFCEYSGIPISDFTAVNFEKPVEKIKISQPILIKKTDASMFYPAFKLRENPFQYSNLSQEINNNLEDEPTKYPLVKTEASKEVLMKLISGTDCLFIGERGIGKSTIGEIIAVEMASRGKKVYRVISPETHVDLYIKLFEDIYRGKDDKILEINELIKNEMLQNNYFSLPMRLARNSDGTDSHLQISVCDHMQCPRPKRCVLMDKEGNFYLKSMFGVGGVLPKDVSCPLYRWLIVHVSAYLIEGNEAIFIDCSDDIENDKTIQYFFEFVKELRKWLRLPIIIVATRNQYVKLRKTEYFSRFQNQTLKALTPSEIKEILTSRIKSVSEGESKELFSDDTLNYIVSQAKGNPRQAITYASRVLEVMILENRTETADLEFCSKSLEGRMTSDLSPTDAIENVVRMLRDKKAGWVLNEDFKNILEEEYHIMNVAPESLGRILAKMGVKSRATPKMAYWFGS